MKCLSNIKSYLKKVRTPKIKVKTKTKMINTILIFILGIILGIFSKWLDNLSIDNSIYKGGKHVFSAKYDFSIFLF
mgnify:CR=1 FL=1